jgi:hypothetical protein
VINWILEVEEVEDVACTVDEMEAMSHSRSLVQRNRDDGMREGGTTVQGYKETNTCQGSHCFVTVLGAGGARLCITALFGRGSRGSAEK